MKRFEDWVIRLEAFIKERTAQPFKWGQNDCCLFAADAICAMTGVDLAQEYRGKYANKTAAKRLLASLGGGGVGLLAATFAGQLGLEEVPPLFARRGDVILVETMLGPTLGIVSLDGWHCYGPGEECLHAFPLDKCSKAWRVE